jgi:hypothetical protein
MKGEITMADEKSAEKKPRQEKTDLEYWETVNPKTGERYDIPMLDKTSGAYVWDYIAFMKVRESNPGMFERILNWD